MEEGGKKDSIFYFHMTVPGPDGGKRGSGDGQAEIGGKRFGRGRDRDELVNRERDRSEKRSCVNRSVTSLSHISNKGKHCLAPV